MMSRDALRSLGIGVDDAAEEHVILHARRGVDDARLIELDRASQILRQLVSEHAPRCDDL